MASANCRGHGATATVLPGPGHGRSAIPAVQAIAIGFRRQHLNWHIRVVRPLWCVWLRCKMRHIRRHLQWIHQTGPQRIARYFLAAGHAPSATAHNRQGNGSPQTPSVAPHHGAERRGGCIYRAVPRPSSPAPLQDRGKAHGPPGHDSNPSSFPPSAPPVAPAPQRRVARRLAAQREELAADSQPATSRARNV